MPQPPPDADAPRDAAPPPADGRARRAARSRAALLAAARDLMAEGAEVTVPAAAARAGVSRATAYRHFATPEPLVLEAALDIHVTPTAEILAGLSDPRARALAVQTHFLRLAREEEARFRPYLARCLDAWSREGPRAVTRGARRAAAFREALAPAGLPPAEARALAERLSLLAGIETHIVLADVLRLPPDLAETRARETAEAVLDRWLPKRGGPRP